MTVIMETVAESGKGGVESRKYTPDSAWVWRMSRLTRDGTVELTRETKLSVANGDRENPIFLVQLTTSRFGNHTRLMPNLLKVTTTHTHTLEDYEVYLFPQRTFLS